MAKQLIELKPYLRDGASLAYVVGDQASYFQIPIRTSKLLGEVAESIGGYTVIYALSDFLIMILSWLVKQSLRAFLFQEVQL